MPISSVSATSNTPYVAAPAPAKSTAETGSSDAAAAPAPAAAAKPDTDAKSAAPDTDAPSTHESGAKSASAPDMFRINPDGTVGPLHQKRHSNAPGVVHA